MPHPGDPVAPGTAALLVAVERFARYAAADRSWSALLTATGGLPDPALMAHRRALLVWLNAWGCRIRYPRDGEPDPFDERVGGWWRRWSGALPARDTALADLSDDAIALVGESYADLTATVGGRAAGRLGPTAAAKMMHALRPRTLMPWDAAIARRLHGARDGAAYAAHQRTGREWARRLLDTSGLNEERLATELGAPGRPLAKLLDEYCYVTFTLDGR